MPSRNQNRNKSDKKSELDKTAPGERRKRHPVIYAFSIALLLIIVISFVGGPLISGVGGRKPLVFGKYNNKDIEYVPGSYLARQRDILYDQQQETTTQSYEYQAYQVWKGAYDRTVIHTAILQEADASGLYISDNRIDELLLTTGPYMEDGEFSETRYKNTPNAEKFRYRKIYREEYAQQKYLQDSLHYGLIGTKEADFVKEMASNERSFKYVLFSYNEYPDSEVSAYATENENSFQKIKISRITINSNEGEASTIRKQIEDGVATFEDQARNFSTDSFSEKGGDMGWREYNSLVSDFSDPENVDSLFALNKGEISDVFATGFGWVFYRIDEPAVAPDLEDEGTLDSVRSYMSRFERGKIEDFLSSKALTFSEEAKNSTFESAAEKTEITLKTTGSFPINYGNAFYFNAVQGTDESQDLANASRDESLLTALFSLDADEVSEPIVLGENVAVFQLEAMKTLEDEDVAFLEDYYPIIVQQNLEQDLNNFIFNSEKHQNNFSSVFSETFLGQ